MIALIKKPIFQIWFSVAVIIVSSALVPLAYIFGWLESVKFVSELSILALWLGGITGLIAALIAYETQQGYTLNIADKQWIEETIERKLREHDNAIHSKAQ